MVEPRNESRSCQAVSKMRPQRKKQKLSKITLQIMTHHDVPVQRSVRGCVLLFTPGTHSTGTEQLKEGLEIIPSGAV